MLLIAKFGLDRKFVAFPVVGKNQFLSYLVSVRTASRITIKFHSELITLHAANGDNTDEV